MLPQAPTLLDLDQRLALTWEAGASVDRSGHLGGWNPRIKVAWLPGVSCFKLEDLAGERAIYRWWGEWKVHTDFLNPAGDFDRHLGPELEGGHVS